MTDELYKKYRPTMLKHVIGQDEVVTQLKQLKAKDALPHFILLSGPSGTGKTTLARIILKKMLKIGKSDYQEINSANFRGIEMAKDISRRSSLKAVTGDYRGWALEEVHQLTKPAQEALLKPLEDTHSHVYHVFTTTHPGNLLAALRNRATHFALKALSPTNMEKVVQRVLKGEKASITEEVMDKLIDVADGSPRKVLVDLQRIILMDEEEEQLKCLSKQDEEKSGFELARMLMDSRSKWPQVARLLKELEHDPEGVRRAILGYCNTVMLGKGKMGPRAHLLATIFSDNLFNTGKCGLTAGCFEFFHEDTD